MTATVPSEKSALRVPAVVWTLGFVSMFMDISSEMIHGLLPAYLVTIMGASATKVGFIEGFAEATASITKIFSGSLSDWLGRRQLLVAIGYGISALTKPIFPLAASVSWLIGARVLDRVGKGIRGAPRDALIADVTPAAIRGAAFGLRQSLDTVGAFTGPLLALALMSATANNFRAVFWFAVIPALLSFLLVAFGVRDAPRSVGSGAAAAAGAAPRPAPRDAFRAQLRLLPRQYWNVVLVGSLLTLARVSEAFLILRAQQQGLAIGLTPLVLIVMNLVYTVGAYPLGKLGDRLSKTTLLAAGAVTLAGAQLLLAFSAGMLPVALGVLTYGLHLALTQGVLAALLAATAPVSLRARAFGVFYLLTGLTALASGIVAGSLWDRFSPAATFAVGSIAAALSLLAMRPLSSITHA